MGTPLIELVLLKNPSVVVMNHGLRGRGRHLGVVPPVGQPPSQPSEPRLKALRRLRRLRMTSAPNWAASDGLGKAVGLENLASVKSEGDARPLGK